MRRHRDALEWRVAHADVGDRLTAFFALIEGLQEVVKASIVGSIIGNVLLVMGAAMLVGGWSREKQTFSQTAANAQNVGAGQFRQQGSAPLGSGSASIHGLEVNNDINQSADISVAVEGSNYAPISVTVQQVTYVRNEGRAETRTAGAFGQGVADADAIRPAALVSALTGRMRTEVGVTSQVGDAAAVGVSITGAALRVSAVIWATPKCWSAPLVPL